MLDKKEISIVNKVIMDKMHKVTTLSEYNSFIKEKTSSYQLNEEQVKFLHVISSTRSKELTFFRKQIVLYNESVETLNILKNKISSHKEMLKKLNFDINDHTFNSGKGELVFTFDTVENLDDYIEKNARLSEASVLLKKSLRKSYAHLYNDKSVDLVRIYMDELGFHNDQLIEVLRKKLKTFTSKADLTKHLEQQYNVLSGGSGDSKKIIDGVRELGGSVKYADEQFIVIDTQASFKVMTKYGTSDWCIHRSKGTFDSYLKNGTSKQYIIMDLSKPKSDVHHLLGATIDMKGNISHAHDYRDNPVKNDIEKKDYYSVIRPFLTRITAKDVLGIAKNFDNISPEIIDIVKNQLSPNEVLEITKANFEFVTTGIYDLLKDKSKTASTYKKVCQEVEINDGQPSNVFISQYAHTILRSDEDLKKLYSHYLFLFEVNEKDDGNEYKNAYVIDPEFDVNLYNTGQEQERSSEMGFRKILKVKFPLFDDPEIVNKVNSYGIILPKDESEDLKTKIENNKVTKEDYINAMNNGNIFTRNGETDEDNHIQWILNYIK